jgi:hypothetical protein
LATAAVAALNADPKHCESVRRPGTSVNKTVHEFKKAWNETNPHKRIPVGTSKYEQSVADALNTITSGMAPAGCGEKNMPQYHRPEPPRMECAPLSHVLSLLVWECVPLHPILKRVLSLPLLLRFVDLNLRMDTVIDREDLCYRRRLVVGP